MHDIHALEGVFQDSCELDLTTSNSGIMLQFMFVVIKVILDGISGRISHVHARVVLGLLSGMIVMYYSLPMISCAQRIFQYFSPCMGVFGYGVDPIDLFSFHTLSSYLAVCAVVHCLLTGTVMHIHAYCLHITLEGGNVTHGTHRGARDTPSSTGTDGHPPDDNPTLIQNFQDSTSPFMSDTGTEWYIDSGANITSAYVNFQFGIKGHDITQAYLGDENGLELDVTEEGESDNASSTGSPPSLISASEDSRDGVNELRDAYRPDWPQWIRLEYYQRAWYGNERNAMDWLRVTNAHIRALRLDGQLEGFLEESDSDESYMGGLDRPMVERNFFHDRPVYDEPFGGLRGGARDGEDPLPAPHPESEEERNARLERELEEMRRSLLEMTSQKIRAQERLDAELKEKQEREQQIKVTVAAAKERVAQGRVTDPAREATQARSRSADDTRSPEFKSGQDLLKLKEALKSTPKPKDADFTPKDKEREGFGGPAVVRERGRRPEREDSEEGSPLVRPSLAMSDGQRFAEAEKAFRRVLEDQQKELKDVQAEVRRLTMGANEREKSPAFDPTSRNRKNAEFFTIDTPRDTTGAEDTLEPRKLEKKYRLSLSEKQAAGEEIPFDPSHDMSTLTVESVSKRSTPVAHPIFPKEIKGMKLPDALMEICLWEEKSASWMGTQSNAGNRIWKLIQRAVHDWLHQRYQRLGGREIAKWNYSKIWPGGKDGDALSVWASQQVYYIEKCLESDEALYIRYLEECQMRDLNPLQKIIAVYITVYLQYGVGSVDDLLQLATRLQNPKSFIDKLDGKHWRSGLMRWIALRTISGKILKQAFEMQEDLKPSVHRTARNLQSLVDFMLPKLHYSDEDDLKKLAKGSGIDTLHPTERGNEMLLQEILDMCIYSQAIFGYEIKKSEPPKKKANAGLEDTSGNDSGGKGGKGEKPKKETANLTAQQRSDNQRQRDHAVNAYISLRHPNKTFERKAITDEMLAAKKGGQAALAQEWSAHLTKVAEEKAKGKGKGKGTEWWQKASPSPKGKQKGAGKPKGSGKSGKGENHGICYYILRGETCPNGTNCRFLHELPKPSVANNAQGGAQSSGSEERFKRDCHRWVAEGVCPGKEAGTCKYQHHANRKGAGLPKEG